MKKLNLQEMTLKELQSVDGGKMDKYEFDSKPFFDLIVSIIRFF